MSLTRRRLLQTAALSPWLAAPGESLLHAAADKPAESRGKKLPVAGVVTVYQENSHADVIVGKVLEGWRQKGGPGPGLSLRALYVDQTPKSDLSRGLAKKHGFPIAKTIDEALTLGTDQLQVAGVLSIGEHGNYPYTAKTRQHMYPRRRFFDGIVKTFQRVGAVVPVFNDKHLSYQWKDALHMVQTARRMKIPFMAGSSLPTAWRRPGLALPIGCPLKRAVAVGYGGGESYGFHALETLQCMVERRRGGEVGVRAVKAHKGEDLMALVENAAWRPLLDAALKTSGDDRNGQWVQRLAKKSAAAYELQYVDGFSAVVLMANGATGQFSFAGQLAGERKPRACWFWLEDKKPYGHFEHLLRAIEKMFKTGVPAYPVERTLLTTGVLDALMHSLAEGGVGRETPHLEKIAYQPVDWPYAVELPSS